MITGAKSTFVNNSNAQKSITESYKFPNGTGTVVHAEHLKIVERFRMLPKMVLPHCIMTFARMKSSHMNIVGYYFGHKSKS